jgi:acetyl-CoA carboxylase biotin carboxyl carrier protein
MPGKKRNAQSAPQASGWNLPEIEQLLDVLAKRGITEFEWKKGPLKVRISRGEVRSNNFLPAASPEQHQPVEPAASPLPALEPNPALARPPETPAAESKEDLFVVKSPIVGTFFAAPAPNAPPFVKVGDDVAVGQVLCIVEAMKLMNDIESEVAGEVIRIYVENSQPVEYGQSLFAIRPSHKKT